MKLLLSSMILLGCGCASAATTYFNEAVLLRYDAPAGDEFAPTLVNGGLTASNLGLGTSAADLEAGVVVPGTVFLRPSTASPTAGDAFANEQYFEFTVSSAEGLLFQPLSLSFLAANGGASGPRGWAIHSSLDGFGAALGSSNVAAVQPGMDEFTVELEGFGAAADSITFRIYGYSPEEGAGIFFDEIELEGLIESLLGPVVFRPELVLEAASSVVHGGRTFHRELEGASMGRAITTGDCFQAWGSSGIDWFGGGAGEISRASGGLAFRLPYKLVGQVAASAESVRGTAIDTDTARLGFAIDNGAASGLQWLVYLGGFSSQLESSRSGDYSLGSALMSLDTEGSGMQALVAAGWWMKHGRVTWGPTAGVEYVEMEVDDAAYWGSPVRAGVALDDVDSLRTLVGVRASHDPVAWNLRPFASLDLATEWSHADGGVLATALGSSTVQSVDGRGTSAILRTGVGIPLWEGGEASVSYLGELPLSGKGIETHGFRVGLSCAF
jgi:hypothetical protein